MKGPFSFDGRTSQGFAPGYCGFRQLINYVGRTVPFAFWSFHLVNSSLIQIEVHVPSFNPKYSLIIAVCLTFPHFDRLQNWSPWVPPSGGCVLTKDYLRKT